LIVTGVGASVGLAALSAFIWWYVGTIKDLDTAAGAAGEARGAQIAEAALPPSSKKAATKAVTVLVPTSPAQTDRTPAPKTAEINEMVVGISNARLAPSDSGSMRNAFTLVLRITNTSPRPMKYVTWSNPDVKVVLRDGHGNYYNRISKASDEFIIQPGETKTDTLVFEPNPGLTGLALDLPLATAPQPFKFEIPVGFIERPSPSLTSSATNQQSRAPALRPRTPSDLLPPPSRSRQHRQRDQTLPTRQRMIRSSSQMSRRFTTRP
jgi:hypothetical protein